MPKVYQNEVLTWKKTTSEHRKNIDLATVFWFWNKLVDNFDPEKTFNLIMSFFEEKDLIHICPRDLWGDLLGESQLEKKSKQALKDFQANIQLNFLKKNLVIITGSLLWKI